MMGYLLSRMVDSGYATAVAVHAFVVQTNHVAVDIRWIREGCFSVL